MLILLRTGSGGSGVLGKLAAHGPVAQRVRAGDS